MDYLSLPLVLRNGYLDRVDLADSIRYSIGLLISTRKGMLPFDLEFGSDLWEKEFSDLYVAKKSDIRASLRNAIGLYEKRLHNVTVSVANVSHAQTGPEKAVTVVVKVSGNYRDDTEEKRFESTYRIG